MPGLAGVMSRGRKDAADTARRLAATMRRGRPRLVEEFASADGDVAVVHVSLPSARRSMSDDARPFRVLVHGRIDNLTDLGVHEAGGNDGGQAGILETLLRDEGNGVLRRLRGQFSVAALDCRARQLSLVSDPVGSHPLYWRAEPDRLLFAGSVSALAMESGCRALDPCAVADFFQFGFITGNATLVDGIQLLPPGTILTFGLPGLHPQLCSYFSVSSLFTRSSTPRTDYSERVTAAFAEATERAVADVDRVGISLSGGLDSRAVLSAIPGGIAVTAFTLGRRGCADHVIARRLAHHAGAVHRFMPLDKRYLRDFLLNMRSMVTLTDGMYLSHGLTEMLALQLLRGAEVDVLLRGHGGELAKLSLAWPFHSDARIRTMETPHGFASYLFDRVNHVSRDVDASALFTPRWSSSLAGRARQSLEQALHGVDLPGPDLCAYLYLNELHRRFTLPSLEVFRGLFDVRLPFVDVRFLSQLFSGPAEWRDGTDLHRAILARCAPRLLRVRNSNTGVPAGSPPAVEGLFDKANTALRRFGVYGFRHYHDFDGWMRRMLLESVESVLLAPACLDRGILQREGLRALIDENRSGRVDHGRLFQVLLILELWQQSLERGSGSREEVEEQP